MKEIMCEHRYVVLNKIYSQVNTHYTTIYKMTVVYYCEKCLCEEIKHKKEECKIYDPAPLWYKENS